MAWYNGAIMKQPSTSKRQQAALFAHGILEQVGLAHGPFTAEELAAQSQRVLGCPVLLLPFECPPRGDGAVFRASERYVVCFRSNTDDLHRRHIIMHELAHMYLGHQTTVSDGWLVFSSADEAAANLLADQLVALSLGLSRPPARRLLDWIRSRFSNPAEAEQERLRSLFE
jgi:hypothetical protein